MNIAVIKLQEIKKSIKDKNLPISTFNIKKLSKLSILDTLNLDKDDYYIYKNESKYQLYNIL